MKGGAGRGLGGSEQRDEPGEGGVGRVRRVRALLKVPVVQLLRDHLRPGILDADVSW